MITNVARGLAAAALTLAPLLSTAPAQAAEITTLADGVQALPLAAESRTGYARSSFKHWVDADKNSCNSRMEVLIAESRVAPTVEAGCKVTAGEWYSYYDGLTLTAPGGLDIDHMVPLAEAWSSGAWAWTTSRRQTYANDLGGPELWAVTDNVNQSKGDQDPATWQPPLTSFRCTYARAWVQVKWYYDLTVDSTEKTALTGMLDTC